MPAHHSAHHQVRGRLLGGLAWGCLIGICAAKAVAASITIAPGDSQFVPTGSGPSGGVIQAGTGVPMPFVSATFHGTLTSTVIADDSSNPYGGLTFTYLIENLTTPPTEGEIDRLTLNDYETFALDASYQSPTAGFLPTTVDRDSSGDVIGFSFVIFAGNLGNGPLPPGSVSALLVLQTDAQFYQATTASIIDGSFATVASFGPAPNVPEPSTWVLAAFGLAGFIAWKMQTKR